MTLTLTDPLADGAYLSFPPPVSADGSMITFSLIQCPADHYGTVANGCIDYIDFEDLRGDGLDARRLRVAERVEDGRHQRTGVVSDHLGGTGSTDLWRPTGG